MKNPFIFLKCTGCNHKFQEYLDWFEQCGQKPHSYYRNGRSCTGHFKEISEKEYNAIQGDECTTNAV